MRKILAIGLLVLMVGLAMPAAANHGGPNPEQSGENSQCLDFELLWAAPGAASPLAARVEVDNFTGFEVSHDGGAAVYVDFYNDADEFIGSNQGAADGVVPPTAAYGLMCVGATGNGWPAEAPAQGATWTYQDGFHID